MKYGDFVYVHGERQKVGGHVDALGKLCRWCGNEIMWVNTPRGKVPCDQPEDMDSNVVNDHRDFCKGSPRKG